MSGMASDDQTRARQVALCLAARGATPAEACWARALFLTFCLRLKPSVVTKSPSTVNCLLVVCVFVCVRSCLRGIRSFAFSSPIPLFVQVALVASCSPRRCLSSSLPRWRYLHFSFGSQGVQVPNPLLTIIIISYNSTCLRDRAQCPGRRPADALPE